MTARAFFFSFASKPPVDAAASAEVAEVEEEDEEEEEKDDDGTEDPVVMVEVDGVVVEGVEVAGGVGVGIVAPGAGEGELIFARLDSLSKPQVDSCDGSSSVAGDLCLFIKQVMQQAIQDQQLSLLGKRS